MYLITVELFTCGIRHTCMALCENIPTQGQVDNYFIADDSKEGIGFWSYMELSETQSQVLAELNIITTIGTD